MNILIPKAISYYTYRSNYAALSSLIEKDAPHFLEAIFQVQAEKPGMPSSSLTSVDNWLELVQSIACVQMLVEVLTSRIYSLNMLHLYRFAKSKPVIPQEGV